MTSAKRPAYWVLSVLLASIVAGAPAARAGERTVLLQETYNQSPWNERGQWETSGPTYLDGFLWRSRIPGDLTYCDLDGAVGGYLTVRWSTQSSRLLLRLKPKSTATPVLAASLPVGTLRFKLVDIANCTIVHYSGSAPRSYGASGNFEITTDYVCVSSLGKYGAVGAQTFEIKPVDPSRPYSGGIVFISYSIEGDSDNRYFQTRYEAVSNAPAAYQGEISANALSASEVRLSGVPGEPLCFSLGFPSRVANAFVTTDIPYEDVRVRWVSKWKPFLMNDPALGGTDAQFDADTLQRVDAGGAEAATGKAWVSFTVPGDAIPTGGESVPIGYVTVKSGGSVINRVSVRLEVYPFQLPQVGAVRAGLFVVNKRYGPEMWDEVHAWMRKARVEWSTNPIQVPRKCLNGLDPDGRPYSQEALFDCFQSRRDNQLGELQIFPLDLVSYEMWRYMYGPDGERFNLDGWIGQSAAEKIQYTLDEYRDEGVTRLWVYSYDEAQGEELRKLVPLLQYMRQSGASVFAAIHSKYWEEEAIRDAIDFWIMTERNYIFSRRAKEADREVGKYGYPFTDIHGYAVHRREFARCLYSGVEFYFNYALNDINGGPFDSMRKMGLVIPTERGLLETESSEGFIRGVYDMRYVAAVNNYARTILNRAPSNRSARQALEYLDTLHPEMDFNLLKEKLASVIAQLTDELYALDSREAPGFRS